MDFKLHLKLNHPIRFITVVAILPSFEDMDACSLRMVTIGSPDNVVLGVEDILTVPSIKDGIATFMNHLAKVKAIRFCEDATIVLNLESWSDKQIDEVTKQVVEKYRDVTSMMNPKSFLDMKDIPQGSGDFEVSNELVSTHPDPNVLVKKMMLSLTNHAVFQTKLQHLADLLPQWSFSLMSRIPLSGQV
jgi:hypothetical protein